AGEVRSLNIAGHCKSIRSGQRRSIEEAPDFSQPGSRQSTCFLDTSGCIVTSRRGERNGIRGIHSALAYDFIEAG
ncbi:MAG TPA: hypothetical protein VF249_02575, partial [Arthrobacter sp.]